MNETGRTVSHGAYERMQEAWHWLCEQRAAAPEQADIWDIRWQYLTTGPDWLTGLTHRVLRGEYRLSPLQLQGRGGSRKAAWGAKDALVLKWVALSLQAHLPLHHACEHVRGHGGGKASVMTLQGCLNMTDAKKNIRVYPWVCRTDIRGYYRNIRKETLQQQVDAHVRSPALKALVHQYLYYTVEDGGTFHTPEQGISRGCPLSPLMGALHLYDMDAHFAQQPGIYYARYMDDVIILAKSRWSLRRHTRRLKQWFSEYGFEAHPEKTFTGRTRKGFDWMGVWLTDEGVKDIAPRAKANHRDRLRRLYEQLARTPLWRRHLVRSRVNARVSAYRRRWNIWAAAMLALAAVLPQDVHALVIPGDIAAGGAGLIPDVFETNGSLPAALTSGPSTAHGSGGGLCLADYNTSSCLNGKVSGAGSMWRYIPEIGAWGIRDWQISRMSYIPHGTISWTASGPAGWGSRGGSPILFVSALINVDPSSPLTPGNDNSLLCSKQPGSDGLSAPGNLSGDYSNAVITANTGKSCTNTTNDGIGSINANVPGKVSANIRYDAYFTSGPSIPPGSMDLLTTIKSGVYTWGRTEFPPVSAGASVTTALSCNISITPTLGGNYTSRTVNVPSFSTRGNNLPAVGDGPGLAAHNLGSTTPVYGLLTSLTTVWNVDCGSSTNNSGATRTVGAYVHPAGASVNYPGTKGIWDPAHKAYYLVGGFSSTSPATTSFCPDNGNVNLSGQQIPLVTIPNGQGRSGQNANSWLPANTWPTPQPSPNFYVQLCATGQADDDYGTHSIPFVFSSYMN